MITIFSPMRPFHGQIAEVQLNAIKSWVALRPKCDIILLDDEEGTTTRAAQGLDVRVVTEVKRSALGAPLLDDLLKIGADHARCEILAYITADILLPPDFVTKILNCHELMAGRSYFAGGARVDMMCPIALHFENPNWFSEVKLAVKTQGKSHGHTALDLWVYPKALDLQPPPFPIGRCATDGWAVYKARKMGIPVIDFTQEILLIHQFHDRPAKRSPLFYREQLECVRLFERIAENAMSLIDADWLLIDGRLERPKGFRRLHSEMAFFWPYRILVGLRRKYKLPHLYRASGVRA